MSIQAQVKPARYLRDVELAEMLGVSRMTIWRWSRSGVIPQPLRIGPRTTRWRRSDVEACIDAAQED